MNRLIQPKNFALAGNATITLESENTNKRFTYKIVQADDNENVYFVKLLTGPDNEQDYQYVGCYFKDTGKFRAHKKWREMDKFSWPPSLRAISFFFEKLDDIPSKLHVYHEGRCGRCGRKLTTPESVESGFGPECIKFV